MNSIQKRAQSLKNFRNFCAFIASEYDIQIYSHHNLSASASKNAIYVPDVANLSDIQIDFIYGLVLHEVGHILHTDFSQETFDKIPSPSLSFLHNVLEDSREESLLCDTFEGAKDIFKKMHELFITEHPEIKKMMNWSFEEVDFFKCFTLWLGVFSHRYIKSEQNFEILQKHMPETVWNELQEFLNKSEFEKKFSDIDIKIKTSDDVMKYTHEINDLLLQYFPNPDLPFMSLEAMIEAKQEIVSTFKQLKENVEANIKVISKLEVEVINEDITNNALKNKIIKVNIENETAIKNLKKEIASISAKREKINKLLGFEEVIQINQSAVEQGKHKVQERENKAHEIENKAYKINQDISTLIDNLNALEDNPKNQKKRESLINRIAKKREQAGKIVARLGKCAKMIEKEQSKIEKSEQYKEAFQEAKKANQKELKVLKGKTEAEIDEMLEGFLKEIAAKNEFLSTHLEKQAEYMQPYIDAMADTQEKRNNIRYIYAFLGEDTYDTVMNMTYMATENFLCNRILPNISMANTWTEMANMQIKNDELLSNLYGQIIIDGSAFCSSIENIHWLLDKIEERINSIDPVKEFKKHFTPCFKDMIIAFQLDTLYMIEDEVNVTPISHNVYTTEYDTVEKKNTVNPVIKNDYKIFCKQNAEKIDIIAQEIANSLQPKKKTRWLSNQRSGLIDNRNLWQFATGSDRIFKNPETTYNQPTAATIMIDLSSSNYYHNSLNDVKVLAAGISEALLDLDIEHEIIGYYADICPEMLMNSGSNHFHRRKHSLKTVVFKSFQDENNDGIENIKFKIADNSDGESLKLVVQRLSKQPANKKIVFMLSDFMPMLEGGNNNLLTRDLQNSIKYANQNQTRVYGFNTADEILSSDLVDIPCVSINQLANKSIEKLEEEHFFDFLEKMKQ